MYPLAVVAKSRSTHLGLRAAGVERNRRNIVAAARRHLIESGYHRLSLDEVAADAGVTRVTIYRQFDSKLGLLDAIAEDLAQQAQVVTNMQAASSVANSSDAFRAIVRVLCCFWSTDPELFRRLVSLSAVDPQAQQVIDIREEWRYQQISVLVRRLDADHRLRSPFDRDRAIAAIGAATSFPFCYELATRLDLNIDQLDHLLVPLVSSVVRLD